MSHGTTPGVIVGSSQSYKFITPQTTKLSNSSKRDHPKERRRGLANVEWFSLWVNTRTMIKREQIQFNNEQPMRKGGLGDKISS